MKKFNLIIFLIFLFGFFQLILVYKNFQLMNKITYLEDKKDLLMVRVKKEDIRLDSLSTLSYLLVSERLKIDTVNFSFTEKEKDSLEILFLMEMAKRENGKK